MQFDKDKRSQKQVDMDVMQLVVDIVFYDSYEDGQAHKATRSKRVNALLWAYKNNEEVQKDGLIAFLKNCTAKQNGNEVTGIKAAVIKNTGKEDADTDEAANDDNEDAQNDGNEQEESNDRSWRIPLMVSCGGSALCRALDFLFAMAGLVSQAARNGCCGRAGVCILNLALAVIPA